MKSKTEKLLKVKVELKASKKRTLKSPNYENENLLNSIAWLCYTDDNVWPNTGNQSVT